MFKRTMNFDSEIVNVSDILEKLGKYQILQYLYVCYPIFLVGIINVNYIFVAGDVRYRCRISECDSLNSKYSVPWWPNHTEQCTRPILNQTYTDLDECKSSGFTKATENCTNWIYENHDTMISEFNLACQPWKKNMVGTVHSIGMAFAMLMGGWMADNFGRKPTLLICSLGCIIGNFKALASNYPIYILIEFLEAAISGGVYTAGSVLMVEIGGKKNRLLAGVLFSYAVYLGEAVLALIGMTVSNWKTLIYIIYFPATMFLAFIILGNESPRWLIVKGKVLKAKKNIKEIANMNNINIDEEELKNMDDEKLKSIFNITEPVKKQGVIRAFQTKELVIRFLVASLCRFTVSFIYYGLLINSVWIPGDKNINFLLAAVMSFPGEFISMILMNKIGRKLPLMIEFILCGIACIAFGYVSETWLKVFLFLLGKFVASACYTGVIAYTVELFPTSVRGSLIGLCTLSSALGNMLAPLTPALSQAMVTQIFGCVAVISSGLLIFTPETKDLPLFDTIEQVTDSIKKAKDKNNSNEYDNSKISEEQNRGNI